MDIVLIGNYGSGKGTQSALLVEQDHYTQFATGNIIRSAVHDGTPLGAKAQTYLTSGDLVPDDIISEIVDNYLDTLTASTKLVFDGYPRTIPQLQSFQKSMQDLQRDYLVILLKISDTDSIQRQVHRKFCNHCQQVYLPSYSQTICEKCQHPLTIRADNDPTIASKRTDSFAETIAPVITEFRKTSKFHEIDGTLPISDIREQILQLLNNPER